jgi:gliding motility-associated lipoprotein GldD
MNRWIALSLFFLLAFTACEEPVYTPKPRGYPRIEFPQRTGMASFDRSDCPLSFEYPAYFQVRRDPVFFEGEPTHSCWFDLYVPEFDSRLHCSYLPVSRDKSFDDLRSDAFDLANWHTKKANFIDEIPVRNDHGAEGIIFTFEGEVATQYQFWLTDSLRQHFFRAALYFNAQARPDSLAPMEAFLQEDIEQIIATFRWE